MVSHYHADHFNALYYIDDKSLRIHDLYYPYVPEFEFQEKLIKIIHFSSFLENLSYIKSGSCAFDLISLIEEKTSEKLSYKPLYIGMSIGNNPQYKVIWPPKDVSDFNVPYLSKKIKDIEDCINISSKLSSLWAAFDRAKIDENQFLELDYSKLKIDKECLSENYDVIQSIERKVRAITNRFSVCLCFEGKFLFLGDLEKEEVSSCLRNLQKPDNFNKIFVKYLITPHHGTAKHYCDDIKRFVNAEYVISSNGQKRIKKYEKKYDEIGMYNHCTYVNGIFYGIENLSSKIITCVSPNDIFYFGSFGESC